MSYVYLICFLLLAVGVIFLLGLTPEMITDDLMRFVSPKQTLREQILTVKGKKKSRKLTLELHRIRDALEKTGKGNIIKTSLYGSATWVMSNMIIQAREAISFSVISQMVKRRIFLTYLHEMN